MTGELRARNPRTGVVDFRVPAVTRGQLTARAEQLRASQPAWAAAPPAERAAAVLAFSAALAQRRAELVAALLADTGRLRESEMEVAAVLAALDRWARTAPDLLARAARRPTQVPGIDLAPGADPYPLVGVVSPWNVPLLLSLIDAVPALLAGCAVLVKPSEVTPRFVAPVTGALAAVPELAAVLAYVHGGPDVGRALVELVDAVCFTGSVPTGRAVAEAAARRLIPAFLELGGKDPAVVLEGADVDTASTALLWGSLTNAGQSCQAIERIYVARSLLDDFVAALTAKAAALRLAHPEPADGQVGPIIAERQARVIADHLDDAYAKGAVACCGGEVVELGGGLWCPPTVLTGVDHGMKVMVEETFGPVMPVMPFDAADEAVALANDTEYGLSAAVFGPEPEALAVAQRLEAGAVSVNDAALTAIMHEGEKQAFKQSGLGGTRMGPGSLARFLRRRAFYVKHGPQADPWWFPSDPGR